MLHLALPSRSNLSSQNSAFQPWFRGTQRLRKFLIGFPVNTITSSVLYNGVPPNDDKFSRGSSTWKKVEKHCPIDDGKKSFWQMEKFLIFNFQDFFSLHFNSNFYYNYAFTRNAKMLYFLRDRPLKVSCGFYLHTLLQQIIISVSRMKAFKL